VRIGGHVYSDRYGRKELKRIRSRISREFYTPRQLLRIAAKARRIGLVTTRDVVVPLLKLPALLGSVAIGKAHKKRQRTATGVQVSASNHAAPAK
jgi:hypothetical protein